MLWTFNQAQAVEAAEARCDVLAKQLQASEDNERKLSGAILATKTQIKTLEQRVGQLDEENAALTEALDAKRDELLVMEGKLENTQAAYDDLAKNVRLYVNNHFAYGHSPPTNVRHA